MTQNKMTRLEILKIKARRSKVLFLLAIIFLYNTNAQNYTHQSKLGEVSKDSLYKLNLLPSHSKYMASDFRDVRLFDTKGNIIPYAIISEPIIKSKTDFVEYEIKSIKHFKTYSEIIIHNSEKQKINNIAFNINNSDAYKYCTVEGSDDLNKWYSVSALQELYLLYNENYTNQYKCIYFPLSDYKYFRLLIDDWYSNPLKVNSAGYFKNTMMAGKLNKLESNFTIKHQKLKKKSIIDIWFNNVPKLDQLEFKISSPRLFKRQAVLFVTKEKKEKKKKKIVEVPITNFELSSESKNYINLNGITENHLIIEIENNDNPPLQIDSVICSQLASYLIADLKKGEKYVLKFGDTKLTKPVYDLSYFVKGVPQLYPSIDLNSIEKINALKDDLNSKNNTSFFEKPYFIWLSLGFGALVISLFAYSLLKDVNKKND